MCFSASASFISSGGLAVIGGATFATAKKQDKFVAAVPLMFAIQQAIEGIQWLYLNSGSSSILAGYGFLFFALIVWPVYTPIFVYILDKKQRHILKWFVILGSFVGLYHVFELLLTQSLIVSVVNKCVNYNVTSLLDWGPSITVAYMVSIFGVLFFSSKHSFKWLGVVVAVLALIAWYIYTVNFTSVWCFFAAIVSSLIFVYILSKESKTSKSK